ncbi:hypothetical protein HPB48_023103 [Haemaphysalis longicornis]|uniref:Uncharacterized protein n=1 Tax=Haemaphysalis longicornis TaxID=44386 RepID=A0A9J6G162_HAELO|nr:hypothetical protein HPB48_023103 [Haemaphysalis longicornis]
MAEPGLIRSASATTAASAHPVNRVSESSRCLSCATLTMRQDGSDHHRCQAQMRLLLEQVLRNERSIMQIISHSARQSSNRGPLTLRMADIGNMTPSLSASLWLTSLNKHLRPYVLHPDDELLVVGDAVGTALDRIFSRPNLEAYEGRIRQYSKASSSLLKGDRVLIPKSLGIRRYTNDQILEFVAWWFVQMYSSSLSHSAAVATFGNEQRAFDRRRITCYAFVETHLESALLLERAKRLSLQDRTLSAVMQPIFRQLQDAAIRLTSRSASWLDENARLQAAAILNRTQLEPEIWRQCGNETWSISPPLRAYIGAIPRTFGTAFEGWIEAAKIHRDHFPGWPINGSILHHNNNFYQLVNYDYWRNSIYAHPAVLSQPVYYADGPDAIMYGGLGVMLARKLVKAIDMKGVFLDADRRPHNWLSKKSWEVLMKKVICAGNSVTLSEIAAIEVAVEAYEATNMAKIAHSFTGDVDDVFTVVKNGYLPAPPTGPPPSYVEAPKTALDEDVQLESHRCHTGCEKAHSRGNGPHIERNAGQVVLLQQG